jgi:hypothetical protein
MLLLLQSRGSVTAAAVAGEWVEVTLRFAAVMAARTLLSFGDDVVVTASAEVREDLRATAAAVVASYSSPGETRDSQPLPRLSPSTSRRRATRG